MNKLALINLFYLLHSLIRYLLIYPAFLSCHTIQCNPVVITSKSYQNNALFGKVAKRKTFLKYNRQVNIRMASLVQICNYFFKHNIKITYNVLKLSFHKIQN